MSTKRTINLGLMALAVAFSTGQWAEAENVLFDGKFEGVCVPDAEGSTVPEGWLKAGTVPPLLPIVECVNDNGPSESGSQAVRFYRPTGSSSGRGISIHQDPMDPILAAECESVVLSADIKVISHNLEAGGWVTPAGEWPAVLFVRYRRASNGETQDWKHGFYLDPPGDSNGGPVADPGSGIIAEFKDTLVQQGEWASFSFDLLSELPDFGELVRIYVGAAGWGYEGLIDNVVLDVTRFVTPNALRNGEFEGPCVDTGDGSTVPEEWTKTNPQGPLAPIVECVADNGPSLPGSQATRFYRPTGSASGRAIYIHQEPMHSIFAVDYESITLSADIKVISHNLEAGGWVTPAGEWPAILFVKYRLASDPSTIQNWKHGFYLDPPGDSTGGPIVDPGSGIIAEFKDTLVEQGEWTSFTFDLKNELPDFGELVRVYVGAAGWGYEGLIDNVVLDMECAPHPVSDAIPVASSMKRNRCLTYEMRHQCLDESFAIRVTSPDYPSMVKFAGPQDHNGAFRLVCDSICFDPTMMPDVVHLTGQEVIPDGTTYEIELVPCSGTSDSSVPVQIETAKWADVDEPFDEPAGPAQPDFRDISYLVSCFLSSGEDHPIDRCDLVMEVPDGVSDFRDIEAGVNAFIGATYPYGDPFSCTIASVGGDAPDHYANEPGDTENIAHVLVVPRTTKAAPGDLVDVDFFLQYDGDVRVYQLAVSAGRGGRETSLIEALRIDSDRDEFVFAGEGVIDAVDVSGKRLGGIVVLGGVEVSGIRYLGTASVRIPDKSKAQLEVELRLDGQTFALDSDGRSIPLKLVNTAKIKTASHRTARMMED